MKKKNPPKKREFLVPIVCTLHLVSESSFFLNIKITFKSARFWHKHVTFGSLDHFL